MLLQNGFVDFWEWAFADSAAILLVLCGIMALIWFAYEGVRRGWIEPKNESWERDSVSKSLKTIIVCGLILGIIVVISSLITMTLNLSPSDAYLEKNGPGFDVLTSVMLLIMGVVIALKPLEDVPLATVISVVAGAAVVFIVALLLPADAIESEYGNSIKWALVVVFIIVAGLVGLATKYWINTAELISKVISWPPFALVVGILCLLQGLLVWWGGITIIMI